MSSQPFNSSTTPHRYRPLIRLFIAIVAIGLIAAFGISPVQVTVAQDDPCATPQIAPTFATGDEPVATAEPVLQPTPDPCASSELPVKPTVPPPTYTAPKYTVEQERALSGRERASTVTALRSKLAQGGDMPVIVGFKAGNFTANAPQRAAAEVSTNRVGLLNRLSGLGIAAQIKESSRSWVIPYVAMRVDAKTLETLLTLPEVTSVVEDGVSVPHLDGVTNTITARLAWANGYDGTGQTIAVLDVGVENQHAFLAGKIVAEACYSTNNADTGATSLCPNGTTIQVGYGASGLSRCPTTIEFCNHGTHVAGIAAGRYRRFSGVARNSTLIPIQVFSYIPGTGLLSYDSDQINGLNYVYNQRSNFSIAAANMSLGSGSYGGACDNVSPGMTTIVNTLTNAGIAVVVSSGNNGFNASVSYPSCVTNAVAVGAITKNRIITSYSNIGPQIDLMSVGGDNSGSNTAVYSSWARAPYWRDFVGTSMAAPSVAAAFALYKQKNPGATVSTAVTAFQTTGTPVNPRNAGGTITKAIYIDDALGLSYNTGNNTFAAPRVIPTTLTPSYTSVQYSHPLTNDSTDPTICGTPNTSYANSAYFRWTPDTSGSANVNTFGSDYDTLLGVFTGAPGSFTQIACNDDSGVLPQNPIPRATPVLGYYVASALQFSYSAGNTYIFVVARKGAALPGTYEFPILRFNLSPLQPFQTKVGLYNNGYFSLTENNATTSTGISLGGDSTWTPVTGDWDGDGRETVGMYKNGFWVLSNDNATVARSFTYGAGLGASWRPITGDWDGNGTETVGVYYNGEFLVSNDNIGTSQYLYFGAGNFIPLSGDWNGDGIDTVGVYANKTFVLSRDNTSSNSDSYNYGGGLPGTWLPIIGDWDGNGTDTVGLYNGGEYILSNNNTTTATSVLYAQGNFVPLTGDWNGLYR